MKLITVFAVVIFFAGLYVVSRYSTADFEEGFTGRRCPNLLVQQGNDLILKNTALADVPGVNPIRFRSLEEYVEFVDWQRSRGINCPVLHLQKVMGAQNTEKWERSTLLIDSTRNNPPYNTNQYPGLDPAGQHIGKNTVLDDYHEVGTTEEKSPNPMDPNWGGNAYTADAVNAGNYMGNEVYKVQS
jgi:hypothetical protein